MLVVPLLVYNDSGYSGGDSGDSKKLLGAIVMQNKREFDGEIACFNEEDIEVMETFAKYGSGEAFNFEDIRSSKNKHIFIRVESF